MNGHKSFKLVVALVVFTAITPAVWLFVLWNSLRPYEPLGDYPVQVVHSRLPGIAGPAAVAGGIVEIEGTKCVDVDRPIPVQGRSVWISRDHRAPRLIMQGPGTGATTIRQPGCTTVRFQNRLPADMQPGLWRLEGTDTAKQGRQRQVKGYWSQDFTVVAAP